MDRHEQTSVVAVNGADACPAEQQAPDVAKGRIFIIMGPPASGKGTQCKLLAELFGFVHISTGDVFRDIAQRGTELGLRAKEFMDKGCYVPDEMVLSLVQERLSQPDIAEKGCLLDGFPRTAEQAEALLSKVKVDGVLFLHVPDRVLVSRAADRRIDPETGAIYHLKYLPPPDGIASRLVRRECDDERSFRQRIDVFKSSVRRVLPIFSGKVFKVDATLEPSNVSQSILRILQGVVRKGHESREADAKQTKPEHSCAICYDEPANFLYVPCGHQCGCEECLSAVQRHTGRCPICRSPVQTIQRVFQCGLGSQDHPGVHGKAQDSIPLHADLEEKLDEQVQVSHDDDEWSDDGVEDQGQEAVSLVAVPCEEVKDEGGLVFVTVSTQVPEAARREPADICCVIDISGSMSSAATYETEDGKVQDDGLSVLDIVKHATKTVLKALQHDDRLAIVAFNDKAKTVLELTAMTPEGQGEALSALEELRPDNQTNIWAGILTAMDALRAGMDQKTAGRQRAILLLTDGQPNICPPRGHVTELRNYKDSHPTFTVQLNTFGFGYNLDSELLLDLAKEGNGTYAFTPDAVIVGTTFVNSVANVLSTLAQNATLNLLPQGGSELSGPALGGFEELQESWGHAVSLGPLQYGQQRDVVVPMRLPPGTAADEPYLEVVLTYPRPNGTSGRVSGSATARCPTAGATVSRWRAEVVSTGYAAISKACENRGKEAGKDVATLCERLASVASTLRDSGASCGGLEGDEESGPLAALRADADGRMSKALKGKDRFNRWGKHYLRALMRSHQLQVCTNFMDPGLQAYGGKLFRALREAGDEIFLGLPAPTPSKPRQMAPTTGTAAPAATPNMSTYYAGAGGGCFAASSLVHRIDGAIVPLQAVRAGDVLRVADGGLARVRCVARIARGAGKTLVRLPGGLQITPKHPVHVGGVWQRPRDLPEASLTRCEGGCVYNMVLDRCHVLCVNGIECATWGHGLQGEVVSHPFFGTERIVEALSHLPGWESGHVWVEGSWRNEQGDVVGLQGTYLGMSAPNHSPERASFLASSL